MSDIVKRNYPQNLTRRIPRQSEPADSYREETLDLQLIVERLMKRKFQIFVVFLVVLIPAIIATLLMTPLYRSSALIQVNSDPVQVMPYRDVADRATGGLNFDNYMGTQEQLLKNSALLQRVAQRLSSDPKDEKSSAERSRLVDRFEVKKIEKSQLFEISYLAASPEIAAKVVNLFAEEYIKQHFEVRQATREKAEQDLRKELEVLEKKVQISETELVSYAQSNNIMSLEQGQVDPVQQTLSTVSQQVTDAASQLAAAKSHLEMVQNTSVAEFPEKYATQQITQLDAKLFQLEQELTTLRSSYGENWPAVVEKRSEIALVREQLTREKSAVLARNLEQAQLDLRASESRYQMLSTSLAQQKALVNQFHNASIQYNILKREADTNRNLYEGLLERLKQNSVLGGFQFGNIQVVEPGRPNSKVDSPQIWFNLGIASLLGLALGICLALLLDFWDKSISTLQEAEQLAPLPSLGCLPLIKAFKVQRPVPVNGRAQPLADSQKTLLVPPTQLSSQEHSLSSEVAESVRAVCASILLSRSDCEPRVIVITSALPAEGKTTLTFLLGRAFADSGLRTVLVEADFRKPELSKKFAAGSEGGLSLFLSGHISPLPKIHDTGYPNLHLIAAGPKPPNPIALFNSERWVSFLKEITSSFRFVIIDAPPLLPFADARILGSRTDGVILVVKAGETAKNLVRRACTLLENAGTNVLGMVLNGAKPDAFESAYYRNYQPQQELGPGPAPN
jgi:capsular exopolysaccharide synthesis family protein